ncbi:MAG: ribosome maturation factor RimM [Treponema sp.]|nr:ribosome maturation factor RimM [Treponema sp.]
MTERFVAALIGAPFGVKGFVKVRSLSGEYDHLRRLKSVVIRLGGAERLWEVEESIPINRALAMRFRGIDSPEAAKSLNGAELITDRAHAAPLKDNEFYVEDLQGLAVISDSGEALGHITGVVEGGGGSLVEIRLVSGEVKLAPFRNEFFGDIRLETGKAVLLCPWVLE